MLDDPFAHAQGQVETAKAGIPVLKPGNDAQGVEVVVKSQPMGSKSVVERLFSGVAKGRMADVVRQCQRLGQFRIETQCSRHGPGDLRHLKSMRQPAAKVICRRISRQAGKDLRLAGQAAKSPRVKDARPIPGERGAVGVRRFGASPLDELIVHIPADSYARREGSR